MNTTSKQQSRRSEARSLSKNPAQIRVIAAKERKRFEALMGEYHYLGEGHSAGDTMRMVAERDGEWVGLLMWGSACYRLKPRDEFIGWTATQRASRQKLVVQNRRFALLAERGQQPNLASHILGAAVRELPRLWHEVFGYEPLYEALCKVPDPRARNRTFHIGAILTITAMAIFSGHQNLVQIVRFANRLRIDQRKELGLPLFEKGSSYRKVPSCKVFYNLLRKIDIDAFAQAPRYFAWVNALSTVHFNAQPAAESS